MLFQFVVQGVVLVIVLIVLLVALSVVLIAAMGFVMSVAVLSVVVGVATPNLMVLLFQGEDEGRCCVSGSQSQRPHGVDSQSGHRQRRSQGHHPPLSEEGRQLYSKVRAGSGRCHQGSHLSL